MIRRKDAPWGPSFARLVACARENPGVLRHVSDAVGSGNDGAAAWVIAEAGLDVVKIPAAAGKAQAAAIGAGAGTPGPRRRTSRSSPSRAGGPR